MSKYDTVFLDLAKSLSNLSYAKRKKVGALIVKNNSIIADGYNGTPAGYSNECEDANENTHWYVLHAEANAITKVASSTQSSEGATLYISLSPCKNCSKLIHQAKIKRVVYEVQYKDTSGLEFLQKAGVEVCQIEI